MFTLEVKKRDIKEKPDLIRKNGLIPAVFYGKKEKSTPISVSAAEFVKLFKQAGESSVITLKGEGVDVEALITEVDVHPVTGKARHADFYVFEKGKKIEIDVPVEFVGVAPAIKELGGTLIKVLRTLKISAFPKDLPHKLDVNISKLVDFKSVIHANEIKLPANVELVEQGLEIVASVTEPKAEIEEVSAPVDLRKVKKLKKVQKALKAKPQRLLQRRRQRNNLKKAVKQSFTAFSYVRIIKCTAISGFFFVF
jgi:large subunit ribosomal protein L25